MKVIDTYDVVGNKAVRGRMEGGGKTVEGNIRGVTERCSVIKAKC